MLIPCIVRKCPPPPWICLITTIQQLDRQLLGCIASSSAKCNTLGANAQWLADFATRAIGLVPIERLQCLPSLCVPLCTLSNLLMCVHHCPGLSLSLAGTHGVSLAPNYLDYATSTVSKPGCGGAMQCHALHPCFPPSALYLFISLYPSPHPLRDFL